MFHDVLLVSVAVAAVPGEREGSLLPRAAHLRGQGPEGEEPGTLCKGFRIQNLILEICWDFVICNVNMLKNKGQPYRQLYKKLEDSHSPNFTVFFVKHTVCMLKWKKH